MKKLRLKQIIKELFDEKEEPLYVEYVKDMPGEDPFMMRGQKFQYVQAKYPNGKIDLGVYAFAGDLVYSYDAFRKMFNINEGKKSTREQIKDLIKECITEEGRLN